MQTEEQKKLIDQYCKGEITGEEFTDAIDISTKSSNDGNTLLSDSTPSQECYKSGEPCKYDCSGLCKESC